MTKKFEIVREIGIDAGHRVTHHGSKCKNLHGHRYTIQACVVGDLFEEGEQQGMVLDFGFLKEVMMDHIDAPCDHGMILWVDDPFTEKFIGGGFDKYLCDIRQIREAVYAEGYVLDSGKFGKLYLVPFVPTAENLAKHWFERLQEPVKQRCQGLGELKYIKVWETPNSFAIYPSTN